MEDNTRYVINRSFLHLLIPTIISNIAIVTASLVDVALVSHYFGANGLAVASLFVPLFILWGCIFEGFGAGASSLFSRSVGNNNLANGVNVVAQINTMVLSMALLLCVVGLVATFLVSAQMMGIEQELFDDAVWYGRILFVTTIPIVLNYYLLFLVRADSAAKTATLSSCLQVGINIVLDILFMGYMGLGIKGCALALLIASIVSLAVTTLHLTNKKTLVGLRFLVPCKAVVKQVIPFFFNTITNNLSEFVLTIFVNVSILVVFGLKIASILYIVNYAATFLIYCSMGLTYSAAPILSVYFGEKNNKAIYIMAQKGMKYCLAIGLVLATLVFLFPNFVAVTIFNFEYTDMYALCDRAIRQFALGVPLFFINAMMVNYCQVTERFRLSFAITISMSFIIPATIFSTALALDNFNVIWWNFLLANSLTLVGWLTYMSIKKRRGKFDTLLCLPQLKSDIKADVFFLILSDDEKEIVDYQEMIELFLSHHNIAEGKINRTMLAFEEIVNFSKESNQRKKGYIDIQVAITRL